MPKVDELEILLSPTEEALRGLAGASGTSVYWLLYESHDVNSVGTEVQCRVYLAVGGGLNGTLVHTTNARWTGTQWARDIAGGSSKIILPSSAVANKLLFVQHYTAGGASPWNDGAWISSAALGADDASRGVLALFGAVASSVAPLSNVLYTASILKCWGKITVSTVPDITVNNCFNVDTAGLSLPTASDLEVTFRTAMADANYIVVFGNTALGLDAVPKAVSPATGTVRMRYEDSSGTPIAFGADALVFSFAIFGVQ
jgi:hypothetical protein